MSEGIDIRSTVPGLINASCPTSDVYTGGQPSPDEIERLAEAGIRTIVDLRPPQEQRGFDEAAVAGAAGVEYVSLPVTYSGIPGETFDRFREIMRSEERKPFLVHCRSGNRVGALLVPYLILDEGRTPNEAVQIAIRAGLASQALLNIAMAYVQRVGRQEAGSE
ncbi:MAG TPA: sulfur transferase domain-containing protein [Longimicrobiales bacterium]|nr:sulfur transferase domain-containing protein [Longimicrobiales bacterium]